MNITAKRKKIVDQEGHAFPSRTYQQIVLEPAFDQAKQNFIEPMIQIHFAHVIMLVEEGIISREEGMEIARAIKKINIDEIKSSEYNPDFEDLFFKVERLLIDKAGDVAGNLHIARSRNDMGIAIYRLTLRKKILGLIEAALHLRECLIALTEEHIDTIMLGYTHTQQAQPTTLGHYFNAVTDILTRDIQRFMSAFQTVNRSSMGAAALTTSGFSINRDRMKQLLGFDDIIENAWDAVSGADYIGETASTVHLAAINMGRSLQDWLVWGTQEFGAFKLSSPYVQISSIMPQKQNPVSIEHMRALLSSVCGDAQTVLMMMHNTPFGDIVDTEDDMQPYIWKAIDQLKNIYNLLSSVLVTMEVNRSLLLERARKSFANVTELADTLVRSDKLPFRKSHEIVSATVQELTEEGLDSLEYLTLERLNKHAERIIGRKLTIDEKELKDALSPEHFINIRKVLGGPSPETMKEAITNRKKQQKQLENWLGEKTEQIEKGKRMIEEVLKEWNIEKS